MSVFLYHFLLGFFSPARHHSFKGFWAEYVACRLFAQLMLLAAVQAWFSWPDSFDALPLTLRVAALTAAWVQMGLCFNFCARNALLIIRNVEFNDAELAAMFCQWRTHEKVVNTLLDAQLAFISVVQAELLQDQEHDAGSSRPPRRGW
eukprot:CAMPEP_0119388282 /NCGR_PEP_ID=MMETSP1334-20130426/104335_1 /TAXON_ID=127549 /ORGANISM="Calcidiscus leptoporus, Strain RCC1130" /LENGTH=147 /DNA_ID=CAMNT_0007410223 /DNA_START=81 /DNA_END=521 /DNA_ORIENTATION=+